MSNIDLSIYGIEGVKEIIRNPSFDFLFDEETNPALKGYEKATLTNLGALSVDTGIFTGRSPKDKYIVLEETSKDNIWWASPGRKSSDNKPISPEIWNDLKSLSINQLSNKKLYVIDAFCGANKNTRIAVRIITEIAWQAHFCKNMFIQPTDEELKTFTPDFITLNAAKTVNPNWKEQNLNSEVFVAFNLKEKMSVIGGTFYGGEMKKGMFSVMNYFLPIKGVASMHCSANQGKDGDTAIFFGLSGTGKTTLSTDPKRLLIGDDEHGWDDDGIFNFEGGCYAKTIKLDPVKEPDIYNAIKRDALLENVVVNDMKIDFNDASKTENTRVSYPINHISRIVKPVSKGRHPNNIIFLTCDAFGVLPPVAILSKEQAMYYFLSGYTAKIAGTERGIKEPKPTFSSCFGAAFLMLHPTVYAKELAEKIEKYNSKIYLVNTGWIKGGINDGERIAIPITRAIIDAILDGTLEKEQTETIPIFNLQIPVKLKSIPQELLNPINTWKDKEKYKEHAKSLAKLFAENFKNFEDNEEGKELAKYGPDCE